MKQTKNSLQLAKLAKPTRNTRKIANKLMIAASGKNNFHSVCYVRVAKVKAATPVHSLADVIYF